MGTATEGSHPRTTYFFGEGDALHGYIDANRNLACYLYLSGTISLERAANLAAMRIADFKDEVVLRGLR